MTFDLDAVEHEQAGSPFPFTFGGEAFTLPAKVDVRAIAALQAGRVDAALRILFGPADWERFEAVGEVFDESRFAALLDAYMKHLGMSAGESSASTSS